MNLSLCCGAKRWMVSAAAGLALLQVERVLAEERAVPLSEPARLTQTESARALNPVRAMRTLLGKSEPASAASAPIRTVNGGGRLPLVKVVDPATEEMSPVERELKKLYDRDGRKMPPIRKPTVPTTPPKQRPGAATDNEDFEMPAALPPQTQAAQPMPQSKPGVFQKLNPFARKPAATPAVNAAQSGNPPLPPGGTQSAAPAQYAAQPPRTETPAFEAPNQGVAPAGQQSQGRVAEPPRFETQQPAAPPRAPGDDFENPFPDESPRPQETRPAPVVMPRTVSAPVQQQPQPEENPFTGLKLDDPPRPQQPPARQATPTRELPARPAPARQPDANPFEDPAPSPPQLQAQPLPRPTLRLPAPERTPQTESSVPSSEPFAAPSPPSAPSLEPQPTLTAPSGQDFEPPVQKSSPFEDSAPRLQAPELPELRSPQPDDSAPRPPSDEGQGFDAPAAGRSSAPRATTPRATAPRRTEPERSRDFDSHPPATPTRESHDSFQGGARALPPKPLDPEPAAELPKNPHERKLRMIAQRSGTGFKGFCPVTLRDERELVDASPQFSAVHEGRTYSFASMEAQRRFERDPKKYAPTAGGNDVVLLNGHGREVAGSLDYAIWYKDRLHLFSSRETLETFVETLNSGTR